MRITLVGFVAAFAITFLPSVSTAQNLVANPNFDAGRENWTPQFSEPDPLVSLTVDETEGSPSAPSLLFTQMQEPAMTDQRLIVSACIPVTAGIRYDFSYDTRPRPTPAIASGIRIRSFSDAACTTPGTSIQNSDSAKNNCTALTGDWRRCHHHAALIPAGVVAVDLRVTGILMSANDPPFNVFRIDNVRFGPVGTVPVELQSFELR